MSDDRQFRAVIVGGGIAALEAAFALRALAGERVHVTVVAPNPEFSLRPLSVREPFAYGRAKRYEIATIVRDAGAELIEDSFAWVDPARSVAHTEGGNALAYDALLLAIGAKQLTPYPHATTIDDRNLDGQFHGIIQDIEQGYIHSLALLMPTEGSWPLPLYELALMAAERAYSMCVPLDVTIVTPERAPLSMFGVEASAAVSALLTERGVSVETGAAAHVPEKGRVVIAPGDRWFTADRVIALPALVGPAIRGLPHSDDAFIPIDEHCRVRGTERIYAAGDGTNFPVKHGGIAAQQADIAAAAIAAAAGLNVAVAPLHPVIDGLLLTGREPLRLHATLIGGTGFRSTVSTARPGHMPPKVAAPYLAPYLDSIEPATAGR